MNLGFRVELFEDTNEPYFTPIKVDDSKPQKNNIITLYELIYGKMIGSGSIASKPYGGYYNDNANTSEVECTFSYTENGDENKGILLQTMSLTDFGYILQLIYEYEHDGTNSGGNMAWQLWNGGFCYDNNGIYRRDQGTPKAYYFYAIASYYDKIFNSYLDEFTKLLKENKEQCKELNLDINVPIYHLDKENATLVLDGKKSILDDDFEFNLKAVWDDTINYLRGLDWDNDKRAEKAQKLFSQFGSWSDEITKEILDEDNGNLKLLKIVLILGKDIKNFLDDKNLTAIQFLNLYKAFSGLKTTVTAYNPYITDVTHHWFKDVYFEGEINEDEYVDVYQDESQSFTKTQQYVPDENAQSDEIKALTDEKNNKGFWYDMTNTTPYKKQIAQPKIVKNEPWHYKVKNFIKYGYYFVYDGTEETAKRIDTARKVLSLPGILEAYNYSISVDEAKELVYDLKNPLLVTVSDQAALCNSGAGLKEIDEKAKKLNAILARTDVSLPNTLKTRDGLTYNLIPVYNDDNKQVEDIGVGGVRLQRIDFEKNSSLNAFTILEGMHTKDSEYIYRDLKEFLIELGYFTKADFEEIETDVFEWIIPKYQVYKEEWPDPKYEKNNMKYGSYVRNKDLLIEQRKEDAKKSSASSAGSLGSGNEVSGAVTSVTNINTNIVKGYETITGVGSVVYKNYKQFMNAFNSDANGFTYWGGSMQQNGCGPTSAAILLSGYNRSNSDPLTIAAEMDELTGKTIDGITYYEGSSNDKVIKVLKDRGIIAHSYDVTEANKEEAIDNITKALKARKPIVIGLLPNNGGRYNNIYAHKMCITKINSDGSIIISNPGRADSDIAGNSCESVAAFVDFLVGGSYIIPETAPSGAGYVAHELEGFEKGLEIQAPQKGIIKEIEKINNDSSSNGTDNSGASSSNPDNSSGTTASVDYYATEGYYILIEFKNTGTGVDGWKMRIEGFDPIPTILGKVNQSIDIHETFGLTNNGNLKIILYDDKDAIINDIEDYFKLKKRKTTTGAKLPAGELEQLGVMILEMEGGMDSYSEGDYWIAIPGNGTDADITAGGSGITNSCEKQFKETGHADLWPMKVGDRVPKAAILEIKAKVLEDEYTYVENVINRFNGEMTEYQKQALASLAYNTGPSYVDDIIETYLKGDTNRAKWNFLNLCHAGEEELWGLKYRRAVEWDIFENGGNYEYTEQRKQECYEKYYTNFYYKMSY